MTQRPHHLYSLAPLLSLSLIHRRLLNHGTPAMALGLKLTNHSSSGTHVTFSQTLSHSLLLSSSLTLKQTFLKSSLKGLIIATRPVPLRLHAINGSRFKQLSFSVYLTQKLSTCLTLQTTRSGTLRTTALYRKKGVNLIISGFTLQKRRSLRRGYLPLLLTVMWHTLRSHTSFPS